MFRYEYHEKEYFKPEMKIKDRCAPEIIIKFHSYAILAEWTLNLFSSKRLTRDYAASIVSKLCCINGMEVY